MKRCIAALRPEARFGGPLAWALIGYQVVYTAYVYASLGSLVGRGILLDAGQVAVPLLSAGLCGLAASLPGSSSTARWSWGLLGLAYLVSTAGESLRAFYEIAFEAQTPTRSLADIAWATYYSLAFVALFLHNWRPQTGLLRLTSSLDALVLTTGVVGAAWVFFLSPTLAGSEDPLLDLLYASRALGDLLITLALVSTMLRMPLDRVPRWSLYLLGALSVQVVADVLYGLLMKGSEYQTGSPVDPLWVLSYTLVGLSALAYLRTAGKSSADADSATVDLSWTSVPRAFLPFLSLPVLSYLVQVQLEHPDPITGDALPALLVGTIGLSLILIRQFLTLMANQQLSSSLAGLSRNLENRVAARTRELTTLNNAANRLSQCLSSSDVLSAGVELARDTSGFPAGAVWLKEADGQLRLAAHQGLSPEEQTAMSSLASSSPELRDALLSCRVLTGGIGNEDGLLPGWPKERRPTAMIVVPLVSRGTPSGALSVIGFVEMDVPTSAIDLVAALGAQIGVALENAQRYEHASYLAERDPVTGLLNHRAFHRRLQDELERGKRSQKQFCLVMMDIDGFKLFNDTYGHPIGDQVLRDVAATLAASTRKYDVIARYGGDEFAAILPEAGLPGAKSFAKRVRQSLREQAFAPVDGRKVPLHISFGVAVHPEDGDTSQQLVSCADANLYVSKDAGGDAITTSESSWKDDSIEEGSFGVLDGLVTAVDHKDRYTRKHSEQVTRLALGLAEAVGLSAETQRTLRTAGLLHDVGKIGVPDRILRKPAPLTPEEVAVVKQHAQLGEMIVKDVPNLSDVLAAIGSHHERFDGHGYPRGLKGDAIPMLGRILAVADAYSAMITDRPYRKALSHEQAMEGLAQVAGSQLDPRLVKLFVGMPPEIANRTVMGKVRA